jgi:cell division septum initiation protein DivIVA
MTMTKTIAAARLAREIPAAEQAIDSALQATAAVLQTMLAARASGDVPAHAGQLALTKLIHSQQALVNASSDFMRVHQDLAALGREMMVADYGDCPPSKAALAVEESQAA